MNKKFSSILWDIERMAHKVYRYTHLFWRDVTTHGALLNWIFLIICGLLIIVFLKHITSGD
ncbi:MAG: hypothetical protein M1501_03440 [Candidatus Omnitrophica bacterium]|nr:hypothetical protein [Candidatus Omnitrophota bacterium]